MLLRDLLWDELQAIFSCCNVSLNLFISSVQLFVEVENVRFQVWLRSQQTFSCLHMMNGHWFSCARVVFKELLGTTIPNSSHFDKMALSWNWNFCCRTSCSAACASLKRFLASLEPQFRCSSSSAAMMSSNCSRYVAFQCFFLQLCEFLRCYPDCFAGLSHILVPCE